jgi:outer membrane receptor protein involved in Fe transport
MQSSSRLFILIFFAGFLPAILSAQEERQDFKVLKSSLLNLPEEEQAEKTSITGQKDVSLRDAPATVSVITEEDILRSGSRDLMDVLRLVPGFEFGADVQGVACLGIRGNSANEGGLLVLVDGMEMTEILYASNNFGSIYPIDQIKKIEVIRGPGSVLYGGFAVYAVINILTKASGSYNGFQITNSVGLSEAGSLRQNTSASFGAMYEKCSFSISTGVSSANRGEGIYTDTSGKQTDFSKNSSIRNRFFSGRFNVGKLNLKALWNFYEMQNQTNIGPVLSQAIPINFSNLNLEAHYEIPLKDDFSLSPYLTYRFQSPWQIKNGPDVTDSGPVTPFHVHATRISSGVNGLWKVSDKFEVTGNLGFWRESSTDELLPDSGMNASFSCLSSYLQGFWKGRFFSLSAGTRIDNHSYYNPVFTPRIALMVPFGSYYLKSSFNRSFRTPAIANIVYSLNPTIRPQLTNYFDFEYGGRLGKNVSFSLNLFEVAVRNGIVYEILNETQDGYSNAGRQGTRGMEAQVSVRNEHGGIVNASWSFYNNSESNPGGNYFVPDTRLNLAYPAHKVCLNAGFPVARKLRLDGTFIFLSERYAFNGRPESPEFILNKPILQFNLYLDWQDVFLNGLHLGFGIFDLTNSGYTLIQPYKSFHLPLPAGGREFTFRIRYGLNPECR